ncbi:MAG: sensor histidine kinase [Clostridia bacterium]
MRLSLRQRLTRQAALAMVVLVVAFGAVTWVGTAVHFYDITVSASQAQAVELGEELNAGRSPSVLISHFQRADDPMVWISQGSRTWHSPNAVSAIPAPGLSGLFSHTPLVTTERRASAFHVRVATSFASVADLLRELFVVLALVGLAAGVAALFVARWATTRMVAPVDRITSAAGDMLVSRRVSELPEWSDVDDEFNRLTRTFNRLLGMVDEDAARDREFLAHAAHELRTPLQVLEGNLDLLDEGDDLDPAVREESLQQSRHVLDRLIRLVDDLMRLERTRSERPQKRRVDLNAVVTAMGEDAIVLAPSLSVTVHPRQLQAWATPWDLERALWTVLDNALKYTPSGGRVDLVLLEQGGLCGVAISDNGPGIPASDLSQVFERFYRGQKTRTTEGFGLGLALARALVERDGGRVRLESEEGRGTTVTLLWPKAPPADAGGSPPTATAPA